MRTFATSSGFEILSHTKRPSYPVAVPSRRIVWSHVPYRTIFDVEKRQAEGKTATEYVIEYGADLVRIECKWQNTSGSVDEKMPFLYLNAILTMPEPTVVFALGGKYFRDKRGLMVKQWLQQACKTPPPWLSDAARKCWEKKELVVLDPDTFAEWFHNRYN